MIHSYENFILVKTTLSIYEEQLIQENEEYDFNKNQTPRWGLISEIIIDRQ